MTLSFQLLRAESFESPLTPLFLSHPHVLPQQITSTLLSKSIQNPTPTPSPPSAPSVHHLSCGLMKSPSTCSSCCHPLSPQPSVRGSHRGPPLGKTLSSLEDSIPFRVKASIPTATETIPGFISSLLLWFPVPKGPLTSSLFLNMGALAPRTGWHRPASSLQGLP